MARRKWLSRVRRRPCSVRSSGVKRTIAPRPWALAWRIAVTALLSRASASSPSCGSRVVPMLQVRAISPSGVGMARLAAAMMRSNARSGSGCSPRACSRSRNSSLPARASMSPSRSRACRLVARPTRISSPARWPRVSLKRLKRSTLMQATRAGVPSARQPAMLPWMARSIACRFGSPVSRSCATSQASSPEAGEPPGAGAQSCRRSLSDCAAIASWRW